MPGLAVNFNNWIAESLPETLWAGNFNDHLPTVWAVGPGADVAYLPLGQNGAPSTFCSPDGVNAVGYHMEGKMKVRQIGGTDDDYIGFAVGYDPFEILPRRHLQVIDSPVGDFTNTDADYYLIDWKRQRQSLNSNWNPCTGTGIVGEKGLAISRVTGVPVESELWAHEDQVCIAPNPGDTGAVAELARGTNLGDTGWVIGQEYEFCLEVTQTSIKLTIDDREEIFLENLSPLDSDSKFCLYAFSQDDPVWYDVTIAPLGEHGCDGDPHFRTWTEEHFEYHGQCDLVLAKDPKFADGLGLDVHIRTKLVRYWSYIKNAVIRIGHDVLEIEGSAIEYDSETRYWVNYEYQPELTEFAGFPVKMFSQQGTKVTKNRIEIDLSSKYPGHKIILSTFKEFVKVKFINSSEESYGNTVGMLGDFKTGKTLGRDGVTEILDFTEYGQEWQVLPTDGKLFHLSSKPQFPELCIEPEDPRGDRKRRLGESAVSMEDAEAACAGLKDELDRKDCIYDIVATQDMDMVGAY